MIRIPTACFLISALTLRGGTPEWDSLEKTGRWKLLRTQVEARLRAHPADPEVLVWRCRTLKAFGRLEEAYAAAKEAVRLAPQSADAWAWLGATAGDMAGRASLLKKMSFGTECRDAGKRALELNPKHPVGLQVMAIFYEMAPGVVGGDKAKAVACRAALSTLDPELSVRKVLGEAYQSKDPARIDHGLRQAREALPRAAWPLVASATQAMDPKVLHTQEAQAYARRALELEPTLADAYAVLAQAQAAEWKWVEVDATLARAEKAVPENLNPHYQTARWLILASREPRRAEALLRRYLTQEPEAGAPTHAGAHWRLALALEQQGRKTEALQEVRTAAAMAPKDKDIAFDLKRMGG